MEANNRDNDRPNVHEFRDSCSPGPKRDTDSSENPQSSQKTLSSDSNKKSIAYIYLFIFLITFANDNCRLLKVLADLKSRRERGGGSGTHLASNGSCPSPDPQTRRGSWIRSWRRENHINTLFRLAKTREAPPKEKRPPAMSRRSSRRHRRQCERGHSGALTDSWTLNHSACTLE